MVISLVVWLVLVFLSVTEGIEKRWLEELTTLSSPLQVKPKESYYQSYYYLVDNFAAKSDFHTKSLGEKLEVADGNPYDPDLDPELPENFPAPDLDSKGQVKNLVKKAHEIALEELAPYHARVNEFEIAFGNLQIEIARTHPDGEIEKSLITQAAYVTSADVASPKWAAKLLAPREEDLENFAFRADGASIGESLEERLAPHPTLGEAILLSKSYIQSGVEIGDQGTISYFTPAAVGMEEMRLPVYVAGFYDPGMFPLGQRVAIGTSDFVAALRTDYSLGDPLSGNGFQIWPEQLLDAPKAKERLEAAFKKQGLDRYFTVESYTDYPYTKPIFEQIASDKTLFTLISLIVLLVACSNIISMLILLVNDKKKEIAILQALGLSRLRVAFLFGFTGLATGILGSLIGMAGAIFTLSHLDKLVSLLSLIQGHAAFQEIFYGAHLPNELSVNYLTLIFTATALLSLIAGLVPAIKASKIQPAEMLKRD